MSPKKKEGSPKQGSSKKKKGGSLKKGFNLPRNSVYIAEPITEIAIHGARGIVPEDEIGDLDTLPHEGMVVDDQRRLAIPLNEGFAAEIDRAGPHQPITVVKIDDVVVVIDGKTRVRAARRSNRARAKDGRPMLRLKCVVQPNASKKAILGTMIACNNARRDDTLIDKINKLYQYMEEGGSTVDAAAMLQVKHKTVLGWIDFMEHATDETKAAAQKNKLTASAAAELAKERDPDAQRTALAKMLRTTSVKDRSARSVKRLVAGNEAKTATDRRSQVALLRHIIDQDLIAHESSKGDTHKIGYWQGVVHALALVTGRASDLSVEIHKDLTKQLALTRRDIEKKKGKDNKSKSEDSSKTVDSTEQGAKEVAEAVPEDDLDLQSLDFPSPDEHDLYTEH